MISVLKPLRKLTDALAAEKRVSVSAVKPLVQSICNKVSHPKTAYSCKKSARPSKAELTATKSYDIIMRPCARCASCKINIS